MMNKPIQLNDEVNVCLLNGDTFTGIVKDIPSLYETPDIKCWIIEDNNKNLHYIKDFVEIVKNHILTDEEIKNLPF